MTMTLMSTNNFILCKHLFKMNKYALFNYLKSSHRYCFRSVATTEVRVRFAPSPTGYLHLGGLRTALYNYLFAKLHNGTFILRIEDTDQTRLVNGAIYQLQEDLKWTGIKVDEGLSEGGNYGPYLQSQRLQLYSDQVKVLLDNGHAYHCFCTDKRLDLLKRDAVRARQVPKYDNRCRHLNENDIEKRLKRNDKCCIRFKLMPNCDTFEDLIYGNITYDPLNEGDPVIMKSDGFPTYHFANVVDDHFMKISHVLRGVEWQISTMKHILMYRAFNWNPPKFGHLPLLMNPDGTKLSKRQGDIQISYYRETGFLPQAVINFITNSGGGFEKDQQRGIKPKSYTFNELIQQFDIAKINSHSGKLMPERLIEFNRLELERQLKIKESKELLVNSVQKLIREHFPDRNEDSLQIDENHIVHILEWSINRINKLSDLVSKDMAFLWILPDLSLHENVDESYVNALEKLNEILKEEHFNVDRQSLNKYLKIFAQDNDIAFNKFMKILRTVLSGLKEGPSVAEMIEILGKENTQTRLCNFLNKTNSLR